MDPVPPLPLPDFGRAPRGNPTLRFPGRYLVEVPELLHGGSPRRPPRRLYPDPHPDPHPHPYPLPFLLLLPLPRRGAVLGPPPPARGSRATIVPPTTATATRVSAGDQERPVRQPLPGLARPPALGVLRGTESTARQKSAAISFFGTTIILAARATTCTHAGFGSLRAVAATENDAQTTTSVATTCSVMRALRVPGAH